jgi:hypothetical protein
MPITLKSKIIDIWNTPYEDCNPLRRAWLLQPGCVCATDARFLPELGADAPLGVCEIANRAGEFHGATSTLSISIELLQFYTGLSLTFQIHSACDLDIINFIIIMKSLSCGIQIASITFCLNDKANPSRGGDGKQLGLNKEKG